MRSYAIKDHFIQNHPPLKSQPLVVNQIDKLDPHKSRERFFILCSIHMLPEQRAKMGSSQPTVGNERRQEALRGHEKTGLITPPLHTKYVDRSSLFMLLSENLSNTGWKTGEGRRNFNWNYIESFRVLTPTLNLDVQKSKISNQVRRRSFTLITTSTPSPIIFTLFSGLLDGIAVGWILSGSGLDWVNRQDRE